MGSKMNNQNIKSGKHMKDLIKMVIKQYPEESDRIINRALEINQTICEENPNQSRKVLLHTRGKIYPTISIYKAVLEVMGSKENAFNLIEDYFSQWAGNTNKMLRTLCKLPYSYKLVPPNNA